MNEQDRLKSEEPKLRWYIGSSGVVHKEKTTLYSEPRENIGNSFETEKEAELAVRKLEAWKRLKDKGFRFTGFAHKDRGRLDELEIYCQLGERPEDIEGMEDVCLLFRGEDDD